MYTKIAKEIKIKQKVIGSYGGPKVLNLWKMRTIFSMIWISNWLAALWPHKFRILTGWLVYRGEKISYFSFLSLIFTLFLSCWRLMDFKEIWERKRKLYIALNHIIISTLSSLAKRPMDIVKRWERETNGYWKEMRENASCTIALINIIDFHLFLSFNQWRSDGKE